MKEIIDSTRWTPLNCTWELTMKCNLRCKHCGSAAGRCKEKELSLDKSLQICDELKQQGTREVTLIGGEPFLSHKFIPVAKRLTKYDIKVNVVSNGTVITPELVKKVKEIGINNIGISIEATEKINDNIRGKGTFKQIEKAIRLLKENKLKFSVATTVSDINFSNLEELYKELIRLEVPVWQIQLALPIGRMTKDLLIKKKDLKSLIHFIIKIRKEGKIKVFPGCNVGYFGGLEEKYRIQDQEKALPFWTGCYSGIFEVGISCEGKVRACLAMGSKFDEGDLKEQSFKSIWESKNTFSCSRKFTKDKLKGHCSKCQYGSVCRGGCPIMSYELTGSQNNDPYCLERIENEKNN